jgi:hypothetical protein
MLFEHSILKTMRFGIPRRFLEGPSKLFWRFGTLSCRNVRHVQKIKNKTFQQKHTKCHRKPWLSLMFNQSAGLVEFGLKCPNNGAFVKKFLKTGVTLKVSCDYQQHV